MNKSANTVSTEHTGNTTFEPNRNRSYFFVTFLDTAGTIRFGKGNGEIPLGVGGHYAPPVCPTGEIVILCTGTYIVHMG